MIGALGEFFSSLYASGLSEHFFSGVTSLSGIDGLMWRRTELI